MPTDHPPQETAFNSSAQSSYFGKVEYRSPTHPVVEAYSQPKLAFVQQHVALQPESRILDVGCGNGVFTHYLAQLSDNVTGVDASQKLLAENPHSEVMLGDATNLQFEDQSFDVVFEANLLHHVSARERVIDEMRRVSRRYLVFIEPNRWNPLMMAFGVVVREERGLLRSSRGSLIRLIEGCGGRVIASTVTGMISQNNTPERLVPFLRRYDRPIWWGEYIVLVAERVES
jgi:SAM-dependent methyltransferase